MRRPVALLALSLAVLLSAGVLAQDQVQIQFQTDPLLAQTGTEVVFTVLTVSQVLSMTWQYQGGVTLGLWAGGTSVVNPVAQFQGRLTISATQLRIGGAQLRDAGNYTVEVTPTATTGLDSNSRSIRLRVFDAVAGVSLFVPTVAVEGRNVTLQCTWTAGTELTVQWGKGGSAITPDSRITISGGSLIINPARRGDAGEYTCTVSNPVSAQTATRSLTVYYGPDTPVLTKDTPKECVGGGDVLVGQTVRLTCMSDSLPPALFSWQRDGQPVASGQPDSGVLSLQTFSTDESGRYVCVATNSVTGGSSEQGTDLAIVDTCLNAGEVAGIVIGCLLLIIIIALLIVLIVFLVRRRRAQQRQRDVLFVQKTDPTPRPIPPDPQPNGARDLGQGPQPPLYHSNMHTHHPDRLYTAPRESRGNPQTQLNGLHSSDTHQHNGRAQTSRLLHNTNSYPHNGFDNPAFMHTEAPNANTLPNTPQQHPNILIQTGSARGGAQPPALHVSLNTLPRPGQQNDNNAQMPTIHVNLNSYSPQDSSFPLTTAANNVASQTQQNLIHTGQSHPRMHNGQSYHTDPRVNGHIESGHHDHPGLTHSHSNNASQRNANTQTYQQELQPRSRSDGDSGSHTVGSSSPQRQMPWDLLHATPAYPMGALQRGQTPLRIPSETADHTTRRPVPEARTANRSEPRPHSRTSPRSRTPPRQGAPSVGRQRRSHSADLPGSNSRAVTLLEATHHTQRSPRTQRIGAHRDIRGFPGSQTASRQGATHSDSPQANPLMSQPLSVGHAALSQGPLTQRGPSAPQGADTRALADPNHLPHAHMAQHHRAAPLQKPPQGLGTQTQPVSGGGSQAGQGAHNSPNHLTRAALSAHTQRAQTFQTRRQQTQAALLHPGPQPRAPAAATAAVAQRPPTPPPAIPLAQFQTLPKKRTQHKSPARGPQPPRPPVNMPMAQRPNVHHHPNAVPATRHHHHHHHHHHPGNGHVHVGAHRQAPAQGHGHPAHLTHQQQQQTHRGRPR